MWDHPNCCGVAMWLVKVELGDIADHQTFECKVCDSTVSKMVPHEVQRVEVALAD
jgi:hypothetical protein